MSCNVAVPLQKIGQPNPSREEASAQYVLAYRSRDESGREKTRETEDGLLIINKP